MFHAQDGVSTVLGQYVECVLTISLKEFSARGVLPPREHVAASGDTFVCLNRGGSAAGIWRIEPREAARCPTMHSTGLTAKNPRILIGQGWETLL